MKRLLFLACWLLGFHAALSAQGCLLRQGTAREISIGPFQDTTGAVLTGLTLSNTDIQLKKGEADWVAKNSGGATHEQGGNYRVTLDTTDTATYGILEFSIEESGALPVWKTCFVEAAAIYDARVAAGTWPVNITQWLGVAPNAMISGRPDVNIGAAQTNALTALAAATDLINKIQTGLYFGLRKGVAQNNYLFKLLDMDGEPFLTGNNMNISCTRSIDGGTLSNCAGPTISSIQHISQGTYKLNWSSSDLAGDSIWVRIAGPDCNATANNCWEEYIYPLR